jgi:hypothetical protein
MFLASIIWSTRWTTRLSWRHQLSSGNLFTPACFSIVDKTILIVCRDYHVSTPSCAKKTVPKKEANKSVRRKEKIIPTSKKSKSSVNKSSQPIVLTPNKRKSRRAATSSTEKFQKGSLSLTDGELEGQVLSMQNNPSILVHRASFHSYGGEQGPDLPEKVKLAMRKDSTYFHGREGLGTQWSLPSVKPSEHSAVKAILRKIYAERQPK